MVSFHCVFIILSLEFGSLDSTLLEISSPLDIYDKIFSALITMIGSFSSHIPLNLGGSQGVIFRCSVFLIYTCSLFLFRRVSCTVDADDSQICTSSLWFSLTYYILLVTNFYQSYLQISLESTIYHYLQSYKQYIIETPYV